MKMICPECGLKGTADVSLFGKKVRCPECRHIFRVDDSVTVESATPAVDVGGDEPLPEVSIVLPEGVKVCKKCGFAFSEQFLAENDAESVCAVCSA